MMDPSRIATSVAGFPLAQTTGDAARVQAQAAAQRRRVDQARKAEAAAGIGQPDGDDHEIADRTGDGRRPWEETPTSGDENSAEAPPPSTARCHEKGNLLDLSG